MYHELYALVASADTSPLDLTFSYSISVRFKFQEDGLRWKHLLVQTDKKHFELLNENARLPFHWHSRQGR